jgi:predicted nucleic acid-binding Zn ribbon protein
MTAPAPEKCDVCDAAPVELVLYPVAIHYKGSGFYTTDYGKSKATAKEGESSPKTETKSSDSSSSTSTSTSSD